MIDEVSQAKVGDYSIRAATASDAEALVEMAAELQRYVERCNPSIWRPSEEGLHASGLDLVASVSSRDDRVLIATTGNRPVAFAQGKVMVKERYGDMIVGSIERLYVKDGHRGRGIGSALVGSLCDFFRTRDVCDVSVRYVAGNRTAERFWGKLSFAPRIVIAGTDPTTLSARIREGAPFTS